MRALTETQLSRLQTHADESMWDTCELLTYDDNAVNVYGVPEPMYVSAGTSECGFYTPRYWEAMQGSQVPVFDAILRLPIDTVISNVDRVRITHRHGVEQTNQQTYELVGEAAKGPSALVVKLRLVTDGTEESQEG